MPSASAASQLALSADSSRVRLARLALEAALAVPNVVAAEAGLHGMRVITDPAGGVLRGVSVTADGGGRYAVDLCLVACLAPLVPLGEEVRRRVQASAQRNGLADQLSTVSVEFARVLTPAEVREAERLASELAAAALSMPVTPAPSAGVAPPASAGVSPSGLASTEAPAPRPSGQGETGEKMILLARALVRVVSFLLLAILAVAGIVLAVFCIGTGTSGPSLGGLARLLDLSSLRDTVGSWLGQLQASGAVAGIAAVCGLAAMLLGLLLVVGILVPRRERLVTLASGEQGRSPPGGGRWRKRRPRWSSRCGASPKPASASDRGAGPAAAWRCGPPGSGESILERCRAPCASSSAVSPIRSSSRPASTFARRGARVQ